MLPPVDRSAKVGRDRWARRDDLPGHVGTRAPTLKLFAILAWAFASSALAADPVAPKPLFRDPVFDGAADPVVVWNPAAQKWWMFYTNRRANAPGLSGVAWVHGCRIGIAESADSGVT